MAMDFFNSLVDFYSTYEKAINMIALLVSVSGFIGSVFKAIKSGDNEEKEKIKYGTIAFVCIIVFCFVIYSIASHGKTKSDGEEPISAVSYQIGQTVPFGSYEQDYDTSEKEKIDWIVLDVRGSKALMITKNLLEYVPFQSPLEEVSFTESSLCEWLNGSFYNTAFSSEKRGKIVVEDDSGKKVFCLSRDQVEEYFTGSLYNERAAHLTAAAYIRNELKYNQQRSLSDIRNIARQNRTNAWWLSTRSKKKYVMIVNYQGKIDRSGFSLDNTGVAVRPAIWVQF